MQITRDKVGRQTEFTGVLIIDGLEVDPQDWNEIEKILGIRPRVVRRKQAFTALKRRDWQSLIEATRSNLEHHLAESWDAPVFVTPGITVAGSYPNPAFYAEAKKQMPNASEQELLEVVFRSRIFPRHPYGLKLAEEQIREALVNIDSLNDLKEYFVEMDKKDMPLPGPPFGIGQKLDDKITEILES